MTLLHYEPKISRPAIRSELIVQLKYRAGKVVDENYSGDITDICDEESIDTHELCDSKAAINSQSAINSQPARNEAISFINLTIARFEHEDEKAIRNRDFYFRSEFLVLGLTATATVLSVIGAYSRIDIISSIVGSLAAAATASVTVIIGYRSIKGYQETWLSHRSYVQRYQDICNKYAFGGEGYEYYAGGTLDRSSEVAKEHESRMYNKFVNAVTDLIQERHDEFKENMRRKG